jgi:hypothetical protein
VGHGLSLDPARFPSLHAYLSALPSGLDSYPEAQSKGSMLRSSIEGQDLGELGLGLPDPLRRLIEAPPPSGVWVSAVHTDAVFHAVADRFYPTDDQVIAWTEERATVMARNPMYAAILRVPGPSMLIRTTAKIHDLVQQGTTMRAELHGQRAELSMAFPSHLHTRLNLISNVGLFRGVVRITGGKDVRARMTSFSATGAHYECSWS